ncbi:MAG: type I restriction enzyme HsdR N-terminal domain-containing protein, partial [Halothece sp. Uz-M2-17]|nr:type I restriction enzyme HsdR N-terminal domain-containing protein [Halothece sp. Uz-M2-17]
MALIAPFIQILGYNVFNPTEVIPEFSAELPGTKRGEKVDYAIKSDDRIIMLFECKNQRVDLNFAHRSQLHRYFHATSARIGVLTNGTTYWFFSDLEEDNKMGETPFLIIDLFNLDQNLIPEL